MMKFLFCVFSRLGMETFKGSEILKFFEKKRKLGSEALSNLKDIYELSLRLNNETLFRYVKDLRQKIVKLFFRFLLHELAITKPWKLFTLYIQRILYVMKCFPVGKI